MRCCEMTLRVREWLRNGRSPRILHLFDDVCNLVDDHGDIVSLVSPRVGSGPFTMILEGEFTSVLDVQSPIRLDYTAKWLTVGSLRIDFSRAAVWSPRPQWQMLPEAPLPPPGELPDGIEAYLQQLLSGILAGDTAVCRAGAYGLAGRGCGLTPTGDDVLMGVLYGLWVWYPRREWMDLIVETAVPRTTPLSAAFLRAAAAGEATFHWHELVNGRADAPAKIQAIGHSSGAEAWAGFMRAGCALAHIPIR